MSLLTVSGNENRLTSAAASARIRTALALCAYLAVIDVFTVAERVAVTELYAVAKLDAVTELAEFVLFFSSLPSPFFLCRKPFHSKTVIQFSMFLWIGSQTLPLSENLSKSVTLSLSLCFCSTR
jgi:hypothetical protein